MTPAVATWLRDRARSELRGAKFDLAEARRRTAAMREREKGLDGWDPRLWKGETAKALREQKEAQKLVRLLERVIRDLKGK